MTGRCKRKYEHGRNIVIRTSHDNRAPSIEAKTSSPLTFKQGILITTQASASPSSETTKIKPAFKTTKNCSRAKDTTQ